MDIRTNIPTTFGDWVSRFGEMWTQQVKRLKDEFGSAIEQVRMPPDGLCEVPIVYVKKDSAIDLIRLLKTDSSMEYGFLADITATDEYPSDPRFEVVYNLFSHKTFARIRVKVRLRENEEMPTLVGLWPGANWAEREVWDMFGIRFKGHPDLRRILMDQRWEGHPLRKDYPLRGYQVFSTPETIDPKLLD